MKMPGNKLFQIEYEEKVIRYDIPNLPKTMKERVQRAIEHRLTTNPLEYGKPLKYSLHGVRRIRVGDYRILYTISATHKVVTIVAIDHRKDVYEH